MARKTSTKTIEDKTSEVKPKRVKKRKDVEYLKKSFPIRPGRKHVLFFILFLLIAFALYNFKEFFVVAIVNGQPITRISIIRELEHQGGKQTLNSLVTKTLILQEAQKQNITVGKEEIDKEVKTIEESLSKSGQNLDQVLLSRNMSRKDLGEQVKIQKMVEKILAGEVAVSDTEVDDYLAKNTNAQSTTPVLAREEVKQILKQQKMETAFQLWLEKLQKNAKITYFMNY